MKNSKLIWAVGALFAIALIVGSAGIISAQQAWQAPGQAFPDQDVAPPIDTGSSFQTKAQGIGFDNSFTNLPALGLQQSQFIQAGGTTGQLFKLTPLDITGNSILQNLGGALNMNVKGLILPNFGISTLNATKGMITYDPTSNTVKLYNGTAWTDVGTGTGGDTFWKANGSNGIIYNGNSVTVANASLGSPAGWYFLNYYLNNPPSGSTKFSCDQDPDTFDCNLPNYFSSNGTPGDKGYDLGSSCPSTGDGNTGGDLLPYSSDPSGTLGMKDGLVPTAHAATQKCYKVYEYKAAVPNSNTATLNIGNVNVGDNLNVKTVNASGNVYVGGEVYTKKSGGDYIPSTPSGTWCGFHDGVNLIWTCAGFRPGPPLRQCPPGWTDVRFGKLTGLVGGNDWEVCIKN